jgi:DnaJ-class molecular chaperone
MQDRSFADKVRGMQHVLGKAADLSEALQDFWNNVPDSEGKPYTVPQDPFEILSLPHTATPAEIEQRYKTIMSVMHPDKNEGREGLSKLLGRAYYEALETARPKG